MRQLVFARLHLIPGLAGEVWTDNHVALSPGQSLDRLAQGFEAQRGDGYRYHVLRYRQLRRLRSGGLPRAGTPRVGRCAWMGKFGRSSAFKVFDAPFCVLNLL